MAFPAPVIKQTDYPEPIRSYGCCACCIYSAASGFGKPVNWNNFIKNYVNSSGKVTNLNYLITVGNYNFSNETSACRVAKDELDCGRPLLIELKGHFVLATDYQYPATAASDIIVMDPVLGRTTLQTSINRKNQAVKGYQTVNP